MPVLCIVHTPLVEMQHQLGSNDIKKLPKGTTDMSAPFPEATTLAVPDDEAIHEEHHVPMTTDRLIISHLVLVEAQIVFPTQIEFVYGIPETPAMQNRWHITERIVAHQHIYVPHVCLLGCRFDYQYSTLTRQILDLQTYVSHIHCVFFTIGFSILGLREGITFQGGHNILHGMLFSVLLSRKTEEDSTIGIQRRYIQKSPALNTFNEVWAVPIPPIYQQMRESDILLLDLVKEFQTQFQLRLEYIQTLAMKLILFLYPFVGHVWTMINRPVLPGVHIMTGYYHLSPVYLTKRTYPLSASGMCEVSRLGIACIINDYVAIFTASGGSIAFQYPYPLAVKLPIIPGRITHKVMHGLVIGVNDMLTDVPDILPFYLQKQSSAIESEVTPLGLLCEYIIEFLVEALKHWVYSRCQVVHSRLLTCPSYAFSLIIPAFASFFFSYFNKVEETEGLEATVEAEID
jgi:hypothetical protein